MLPHLQPGLAVMDWLCSDCGFRADPSKVAGFLARLDTELQTAEVAAGPGERRVGLERFLARRAKLLPPHSDLILRAEGGLAALPEAGVKRSDTSVYRLPIFTENF